MLLDSKKADEMQAAVDAVFARVPKIFRTEETRNEIAKHVVRSEGEYHDAARRSVLKMFASVDRAIENRKKIQKPARVNQRHPGTRSRGLTE